MPPDEVWIGNGHEEQRRRSRALSYHFDSQPPSDAVKLGDENSLQRYRVANRNRETSWIGTSTH